MGVALTAATIPLWAHMSLVTDCRARTEQAIACLGRQVPTDPRRDTQLYLALGYAYLHILGGGQEMYAALTKALELAEIVNDTRCRRGATYGLYVYRLTTGDYRGALTLGEQFVAADTADRPDVVTSGPVRDDTSSRWLACASRRLGRHTSTPSINSTSD